MNKAHITMRSCISLAAVFVATTFAAGALADDNRQRAIKSMKPSAYWPLDERVTIARERFVLGIGDLASESETAGRIAMPCSADSSVTSSST